MTKTILHIDDFIEMLERGDSIEEIARYAHVTNHAIERRFQRLPKDVHDRILAKRNRMGLRVSA